MAKKRVLIYGLQRSGTNFLEKVLRQHFRVKILDNDRRADQPAHRYFRPYAAKSLVPVPAYGNDLQLNTLADLETALHFKVPPDLYLVLHKNPYAWYLSYSRHAYSEDWPQVEHHYIEEYNHFYGTWLKFAEGSHRVHLIPYSDLLRDPRATLEPIRQAAGLQPRPIPWLTWLPRHVRRTTRRFSTNRRKYYLNQRYFADIERWERNRINQHLDKGVAGKLGYDLYPG